MGETERMVGFAEASRFELIGKTLSNPIKKECQKTIHLYY